MARSSHIRQTVQAKLGFHRGALSVDQKLQFNKFSFWFLNFDDYDASNDYGDMLNKKFAFHDGPILRTGHS